MSGTSDADREAVDRLSPALLAAGIRLAGLDVIGPWITEVNALNPGGVHHSERLTGTPLSPTILKRLVQPNPEQRTPWALPVP